MCVQSTLTQHYISFPSVYICFITLEKAAWQLTVGFIVTADNSSPELPPKIQLGVQVSLMADYYSTLHVSASSILCRNMKYWDLKFETFTPSMTKVWERGQLNRTLWTLCVLLSSSVGDLQCAVGQSAADSEATGMRIITVMSEAMVLYWEKKSGLPSLRWVGAGN